MQGKELAEIALKYPDFDFEFVFVDGDTGKWLNVRSFENLSVADVGYSSKVVCLMGEER